MKYVFSTQKLDSRIAILAKSNVEVKVKEQLQEVLIKEFISSEESALETVDDACNSVKPLPWRGPKAQRLMNRLDEKYSSNQTKQSAIQTIPRVLGESSIRLKPSFPDDFRGFVAH